MAFCLPYYPNSTFDYSQVDEIILLPLRNQYPTIKNLQQIIKKYPKINIILNIYEKINDIDVKILQSIAQTYNLKLCFNFYNKELLEQIPNLNIPFFFSNKVTKFDEIRGYMTYAPTDMYICEELGFFLDHISSLLHSNNIKIRVYPNICQSSFPLTPSIKTFFIRPDDISIYSKYVDTFELITDENREAVIYKIYAIDKKWNGKISEIIPSFNQIKENADTAFFYSSLDAFAQIRTSCKKRCMYSSNPCLICDRFVDLSTTVNDEINKKL